MTRFSVPIITILTLLLLAAGIFGAIEYSKNKASSQVSPVSMIELAQPSSNSSPRYIVIADPNQKTVSIVTVEVKDNILIPPITTVTSVTPYSKTSK